MKNKITKTDITVWAILAAVLAWLLTIYAKLPEIVPTHFNFAGEADGWGSKKTIFIMWFVALGMDFMMKAIRKIDPKSENYNRFEKIFNLMRVVMAVFFGVVIVLIAMSAQGAKVNTTRVMFFALGALFIVLGNYMPKVKFNYTTGIKTPWTLASENVWNKTHRMAGPLWVAGGLLIMAQGLIVKGQTASFAVFMAITMLLAVVPMAYSYIEFNKEKKSDEQE